MSTLQCTNIQDTSGGNSLTTAQNYSGTAKAWVNYNGVSAVTRASFNVSSVTKNGTGDYTVNFSSAFSDANYSFLVTSNDGGGVRFSFAAIYTSGLATGSSRFLNYGDDGALRDQAITCCSAFR